MPRTRISAARRKRRLVPWWLDEGSEQCPLCLQRYAYHAAVYCAVCDLSLCIMCAERLDSGELACRGCSHLELEHED
ncbi:MAG: hypothetical protein KIT09_08465 [Bryobacteraceae bacterium]|nr:hypothetical protein [Bryobacteraceae bacterium]